MARNVKKSFDKKTRFAKNDEFPLQKPKSRKIDTFCFIAHLRQYLSYRYVQYLILILLTNRFDL